MKTPAHFIIIDDDISNNFLCERAIQVLFPDSDVQCFVNAESSLGPLKDLYTKGYQRGSCVIFLDVNMPEMSGWEFLDKFKTFEARFQDQFLIYMLSSSIDPLDKEKAVSNSRVSGFISKPLIVSELNKLFRG